jgi:hypothetical protein
MIDDPYYPFKGKGVPPTRERRIMSDGRHDEMTIVGEARHQECLRSLLDDLGRSVVVSLVPEPENARDADAIAVVVGERTVGYLSDGVAKTYGRVLRARSTPVRCSGVLEGGRWDVPTIHVVLDFRPVYAASREA